MLRAFLECLGSAHRDPTSATDDFEWDVATAKRMRLLTRYRAIEESASSWILKQAAKATPAVLRESRSQAMISKGADSSGFDNQYIAKKCSNLSRFQAVNSSLNPKRKLGVFIMAMTSHPALEDPGGRFSNNLQILPTLTGASRRHQWRPVSIDVIMGSSTANAVSQRCPLKSARRRRFQRS